MSVRLALCLAALAAFGCAGSVHPPSAPSERPVGEDLPALIPTGADGVLDVDVPQLARWSASPAILRLLPPAAKEALARLGEDPLNRIEALVIGLYRTGTAMAESVAVVRGRLDWERLRAAHSGEERADYHGAAVIESANQALVRIAPTVFAFGSSAGVRRICDVAQHQDEGFRTAGMDAPLRQAFARPPTAKVGRPAVLGALVLPPALKERLRQEHWESLAELEWLSLALAVGDGLDVGIIAGARGAAEANSLASSMKERAQALADRSLVKILGLGPFIEPFVIVAKESEAHVAYRLPGARLEQLLGRLGQLNAVVKSAP